MSDQSSISGVECALLVEDAVARLRHDVFNSLSAVRNAAYYIQRRVNGTEVWQADPRVEQFFQLIAQQLDAAVARIGVDPKADLPHQRRARVVDGADCVRTGLSSFESSQFASLGVASGQARVDPDEFALAVAASLKHLLMSASPTSVSVEAGPVAESYRVVLEARTVAGASDSGDAMSQPPRALAVARRVAVAAGGGFSLERVSDSLRITLSIPDGAAETTAKRVMIVDDEVAGRATLAALLELEGHEVRECSTLSQATATLNSGEKFDAVLVDRRLPDGRGDTLAKALHESMPNATLVLITGEAIDTPPPGFHAAYQKGMNPSILTELVGKLLNSDLGD